MTSAGAFPPSTREAIIAREQQRCASCGTSNPVLGWSVHHRRRRGMGGTRRASTACPTNGLLLCGSGTTGCHGFYERERTLGYEHGVLVRDHHEPSEQPVLYRGRWVLLLPDGGWRPCDPPGDAPVPARIHPRPPAPVMARALAFA